MVKQLIYDSCMIVEMRTIIAVYLDIQPSHKKEPVFPNKYPAFLLFLP